jgi:hypothetical protein
MLIEGLSWPQRYNIKKQKSSFFSFIFYHPPPDRSRLQEKLDLAADLAFLILFMKVVVPLRVVCGEPNR